MDIRLTHLRTRAVLPRRLGSVLLLLFTVLTAPTVVAGQSERLSIDHVSFLAGCWAGTMGMLDMREQWTELEGGVMLGTTRYYREGQLADFEFAMLSDVGGVATLHPYPKGERSPRGFPLVAVGEEYVFENLEHDFPVRIVYARSGEAGLNPRAEGPDGTGPRWALHRVPCPGA
jgi:hypothetical protein